MGQREQGRDVKAAQEDRRTRWNLGCEQDVYHDSKWRCRYVFQLFHCRDWHRGCGSGHGDTDTVESWTSGKGDLATEVHDDSNGVVVFMSGVYFSEKRLRAELKPVVGTNAQNGKLFRGGYVELDSDESESKNECNGFRILVV